MTAYIQLMSAQIHFQVSRYQHKVEVFEAEHLRQPQQLKHYLQEE